MPSGVTVAYTNEKAANAGVYTAKVQFDYDNENYSLTNLSENIQTLTWEIKKAVYDMSGVEFKDKTVTYDGTKKSLVIAGELPKGVTVSYSANGQINAGTYDVTATFTGDTNNYEAISDMTATLTIEKAMPEYTLPENLAATYGETLADVTLPSGWAWKNAQLSVGDAGEHSFAAVFTPEDAQNYEEVETELTVSVGKAIYNMSGVEFKDKTVTYDGTKKSLVIAGELPKGVTVSYSANGQINAGIYKVTVSFAGDYENYERISDMTATLTIEKAMPDYKKIPEGMTATEGQTLSDIVLPEGWSWKDGSVSVGEEGERAFAAVYTPMDTANYNTATVELTVNVLATEFPVGMIVGIALGCIFGLLLIVYGIGAVLYKKGKLQGPFFDKIYPFIKA